MLRDDEICIKIGAVVIKEVTRVTAGKQRLAGIECGNVSVV
jgi:hypothetical protein